MTSSNKTRRYLQHHKQHSIESQNNEESAAQLPVVDSTSSITTVRKFRSKTPQQSTLPIPQICVNNNDDDNNDDDDIGHVTILNEFDQVLDNESKHKFVLRTSSLKQNDSIEHIATPVNQHRSFSFSLGSKTDLEEEKHDDDYEHMNSSSPKAIKLPVTAKSSLSKETFSRLFHSLAFRSGNHSTSKISVTKTDFQHPCLACQNYPNLDIIPKNKKRPSIFGVLVSKLNTPTMENTYNYCSVCKRPLAKSISNNDDNQQLSPSKNLRDQKQLLLHIKRRQSLPSLFHNLLDPSSSAVLNPNVIDNINHEQQQQQPLILSHSSILLTESDDNNSSKGQRTNYDDSSQLTEKVRKLIG
jgi:hypothetical protein